MYTENWGYYWQNIPLSSDCAYVFPTPASRPPVANPIVVYCLC